MKLFQNLILLFCIGTIAGCKEEYNPQVKPDEQSVLVAEGILNSGSEPTVIQLSRTVKISDTVKMQPERGARLTIESKSGGSVPLVESDSGRYSADALLLDPATEYRLHIYTSGGVEYASDYVMVQKNPPIDSLSWKRDNDGVTIFVNTHDPENSTHYYRWEFEETWQIRSRYPAFNTDDGINEPLYPDESLYYCWKNHASSNIILGNTTQLSSDVVSEKPLIKIIDNGDDRLSERYSVLVRQYALDKQGYNFYELLRKNTESLGSIFDAQPTEIAGNVHAVSNAKTPVIGYIMASSVDTARLWITTQQVPNWKPWGDCSKILELNSRTDDIRSYTAGHEWLIVSVSMSGTFVLAQAPCVSCRVRGGSTHKPAFW